MPTDSLRTMALYADGRQIAAGARFHLEGRSTMSCTADKFVLTLTGYEDSDLTALQRAKTLTVTGENDSLLAEAPAAEIRTSVENGVETCTVVLLDGGDFCCGCVSVAIRKDTTLEEALSTLLAHCDSPLPLVTKVNAPIRFSRGQVFFGRTVQAVKELAKSAGYRAYGFDDPTADWDESECNRNENGEFAEKPGGAASESQRAETQTSKKASESSIKGKPESVEIPEKERAALQEKILNGIIEEGISVHAEKRMLERNVETPQVIDAVKNPLRVFKGSADAKGRPSVKFIGNEATACFNPDSGILTSAWPTNHKLRKKYGGD